MRRRTYEENQSVRMEEDETSNQVEIREISKHAVFYFGTEEDEQYYKISQQKKEKEEERMKKNINKMEEDTDDS